MALKVNITLKNGLALSEGYFKIERVSLSNVDGELYFTGALYANEQSRLDSKPPVVSDYYQNSFAADKEGNLLEQAYEYIKGLAGDEKEYPEKALFADFIDV